MIAMNLLITGGLGGIGQALLRHFKDLDHVRIVTLGRRGAVCQGATDSSAVHETGSILDEVFLRQVMKKHHITHLIHAAALRTRECEENPALAHEVNVRGTRAVMQAALITDGLQKVIHLSSAAVYGRCSGMVTEDHPLSPSSVYARSKAESERIVKDLIQRTTMQAVILRPGFVLGAVTDGTLGRFITTAASSDAAHLRFVPEFHLHWDEDLAGAIAQLLQQEWRNPCEVLHPPGQSFQAWDVMEAVKARCPDTRLTYEADLESALPKALDSTKFSKFMGDIPLTSLPAMIAARLGFP